MRFSISVLALLAANPAFAEDFVVRADVAEAVVYAEGAEVVRRATLDLPAGAHRVLFPADNVGAPPVIRTSAGEIGELEWVQRYAIEEGALDSVAQAEARAAVEAAEAALEAAQAEVEAATAAVQAAELQQSYLQSIVRGGTDGVAMPDDAATLTAILATLGSEMARAGDALQEARATQNARREIAAERQTELAEAQRQLAELQPLQGIVDMWAVTLDMDAADSVTVEIDDVAYAQWQPYYDVHLDSGTGELRLERAIALYTEHAWTDVDVTLSTANPARPLAPRPVLPSLASIFEPQPISRAGAGLMSLDTLSESEIAAAPVMEPVVIESRGIGPIVDGLSITYPYPDPISTSADAQVFLPFGEVSLQADLINRAVPRRDATAFLIADIENTSAEPILPGEARFFRDGALIGADYIDFMPAGAAAELPFGPLDHIQLTWTDLSRDTGDRGVFVSSNIEDRQVRVTAENLSGEAVAVELLYATPFSEQEDLEVEVGTSRAPDDTAWEDLRGVYAWSLDLAPGADTQITLQFEFDWPDDAVLDWRP